MSKLLQTKILKHEKISDNAFVISFKREFEFKAGQIIGITIDKNIPPRLYSICSGPLDDLISVLFSIKSDGQLTPSLAQKKVGDILFFTKVQGKFTYENEKAWWIATGTGIAPFRSMLRNKQAPMKLIQGGRKNADFYFQNEFSALVDYIKCSTQENKVGFYSGRLTQYLMDQEKLPTNINYYLCGSAEMVVDVRNLLISKGISFSNIITEIYF